MAFDVYPLTHTAPLDVPPGGAGTTTTFTQERRSSGANPQMYIRVAILGSATAPTLKLQAGGGDPVTAVSGTTTSIFDAPGDTGNYVADCLLSPQPNGVYLINVFLYLTTASTWKLTIVNNDVVNRGFVFVVADSDANSQQPWIEMETAIHFDALITETGNQALRIFNYGTGPLTISTSSPTGPGAASFTFAPPGGASVNPNSSLDIPVTLVSVATPQALSATLDVASNDSLAQKATGHNSEVALSATIGALELAFMLDGSGSMALDPDGKSTFIGVDNSSTRWGKLITGANAALTMLKNFAAGKGTFAVGMYPNITGLPANPTTPPVPLPVPSPTAGDFKPVSPIDASSINDALGQINQHFPRVNGGATPIGAGIAHAIGSTSSTPFGYFSGSNFDRNRRWLVLMTDGNHNSDPPPPSDFFGNGTAGQGFVPKKVGVMSLGYGNDAATTISPVNKTLMTQIASQSFNGSASNFDYAQADATPDITVKFMKVLLFAGLTLDSVADPGGVLTSASPTVTRQVVVTPYDRKVSFMVAWSKANAERLQVQVRTPLGEVLEGPGKGYTVDVNARFRMITVDQAYIRNDADPTKPRYGTWTLTITLAPPVVIDIREERAASPETAPPGEVAPPLATLDVEPYDYQIVTDSRLNLRCSLDKNAYAAGDTIRLSARLSLDGKGVPGAAVTLTQTVPGVAHLNWLATSPVTSSEYSGAAEAQGRNPDIDSLGIKKFALAKKGQQFMPVVNSSTVPLVDAKGTGDYRGTTSSTSVPGTYQFLVTAVGALPDGTMFRREQNVTIELGVRADHASTLFHVDYVQAGPGQTRAILTVLPLDKFKNSILIDPKFDPSILFTTSSGHFDGPITDNHDGSYSRSITYPSEQVPTVGVSVGGVEVVHKAPLAKVGALHFVNKVFSFQVGGEAVKGANKHTDPTACLGDFTKKAQPAFVSLGAGGSLVVGVSGHYVAAGQDDQDITVFVQPDANPRPYSVEAAHGDYEKWFEIGRSPGTTQSFSLRQHGHLPTAQAIRIRDLSKRMRNPDGTPSASPGVSIVGVGCGRIEKGDGDLDDIIINWLRKLGHKIF
jgi:hypothetical protein